jgi:multisubunit Na+/H+ antiporter MnhG subunit
MDPTFLATMATGLFAGAALYVSAVEQPARMSCGGSVAVLEFRPSYRRAARMQASLAIIGALMAIVCWRQGGGTGWLVAALVIAAVVPFTLMVIAPTTTRLLDESLDADSVEALTLLERWGRLHAIRTALGLAAFTIEVALLGT